MQIRHEQFNSVIDLLGHAVNAEAVYRSVVRINEDSPELKNKAQKALAMYCTHVARLYHPMAPPLVYLDAFNKKCESYITKHTQKGASSQIHYSIYIGDIIAQIKQDFSVVKDNDPDRVIPTNELVYTGIFKLVEYATCTIESDINSASRSSSTDVPQFDFGDDTETPSTMPKIHHETAFQQLIMRTLSHPAVPLISVILFLGGIALIVSGSTPLGICTAVIGTTLAIAGYHASRYGFFARHEHADTSAQSILANIRSTSSLGPT